MLILSKKTKKRADPISYIIYYIKEGLHLKGTVKALDRHDARSKAFEIFGDIRVTRIV